MTVLSDRALMERLNASSLLIVPFIRASVQPASYDLHLGDTLLVRPYGLLTDPEVDQSASWQDVPLRNDGRWGIAGNRLYLGVTAEHVTIPNDCAGRLEGLSSLGRQGIMPHVQAGWIDPGWSGRLTLEVLLFGVGGYLRPNMRIVTLALYQLDQLAGHPYAGRYAGDVTATPAKVRP